MNNDKKTLPTYKDNLLIHHLPGGIQQIHQQYGWWITGGNENYAGINSYDTCALRYFEFYSISHLREGHGTCYLQSSDSEIDVNVGDVIIITPNTVHRYGGSRNQGYLEDSIRFCGPMVDLLRQANVIVDGVFEMGKIRRLLPIMEMAHDPAVDAQINANLELHKLLIDIYNTRRNNFNDNSKIDKLLLEIKKYPEHWWTVETMADFCNLSVDQLRRNFLNRTGVLPKIYLDRLKLRKAAEMLITSKLSIWEIAKKFGYTDPYHFSRRFKAIMGVSPHQYRKANLGIFGLN